MRRIIASTFLSLDGVMQAPGGPEEDRTESFEFGGWMFGFGDDGLDISESGFDAKDRELLLGRKTYEIFEAYWPFQGDENPVAKTFNATKKYVASRTLQNLHWNNSSLLQGDVVSALKTLKSQTGPDLQIIGSGDLIQTLHAATLIDEYNLWTFPIVLGKGKRLFCEGSKPSTLKVTRSRVSNTGVVSTTLEPVGDVRTSSFGEDKPSTKELVRREKIQNRSW